MQVLPLHNGLLNYFDKADNAFISAYRKHARDGSFEINLEYISCPTLDNRILIISDPMLATGASMAGCIASFERPVERLLQIHIVSPLQLPKA